MKLTHLLLGALLTLPLSASTQPPSGAELPVSIAEANPSTLVEAPTPTRNGWEVVVLGHRRLSSDTVSKILAATSSGPVLSIDTSPSGNNDSKDRKTHPATMLVALKPEDGSVRWARIIEPATKDFSESELPLTPQVAYEQGRRSVGNSIVASPDGTRLAVPLLSHMRPADSTKISDQRTKVVVLDAATGNEVRTVEVTGMVLGHALTGDCLVVETAENYYPAGTGTLNVFPLGDPAAEPVTFRTDLWLAGATANSLLMSPQFDKEKTSFRLTGRSRTFTRISTSGEELGTVTGVSDLHPGGWLERFKDPDAAQALIAQNLDELSLAEQLEKLPRELVNADSGAVVDLTGASPRDVVTPSGWGIFLKPAIQPIEREAALWLNTTAGDQTPRKEFLNCFKEEGYAVHYAPI
ncbi:hypothetical protein QTN80_01760 [Arachnia propionica]|uniref:hypothetical protein n=1 Tax=Arachnia propionica TaxID=1750 RepID=UPI0039902443